MALMEAIKISVQAGVSIPETLDVQSILTTREYDGDTLDRKFFARSEVHVKSDTDSVSDASISFTSSDPIKLLPLLQYQESLVQTWHKARMQAFVHLSDLEGTDAPQQLLQLLVDL